MGKEVENLISENNELLVRLIKHFTMLIVP